MSKARGRKQVYRGDFQGAATGSRVVGGLSVLLSTVLAKY